MYKDENAIVTFDGQQFYGIEELGFQSENGSFVVSLFTTPAPSPRGSCSYVVPISGMFYRRKYPTKASVKRTSSSVTIYDDYGMSHVLKAKKDVLDFVVQDCISHEIPIARKLEMVRQ
jgi:hypothetical protein